MRSVMSRGLMFPLVMPNSQDDGIAQSVHRLDVWMLSQMRVFGRQ